MFKGDIGITGECCWEPPNSTVCAGDNNPQTRYNYNTAQTETQTGIGTCDECCSCGPIGPGFFYDHYGQYQEYNATNSYEITKAQYDRFQLGGTINWSASIDVNYSSKLNCDWSSSGSITSPDSSNCIWYGSDGSSPTCFSDPNYYGSSYPGSFPYEEEGSSMGFEVIVFTEGGKYYLYVSGHIKCPVGNGTLFCMPVYRQMGKSSAGETDSFSFLGVSIYYDDSNQYSSNSWSLSFTPNTPDCETDVNVCNSNCPAGCEGTLNDDGSTCWSCPPAS